MNLNRLLRSINNRIINGKKNYLPTMLQQSFNFSIKAKLHVCFGFRSFDAAFAFWGAMNENQ